MFDSVVTNLFEEDIVLIDETVIRLNAKLGL